MAHEPRHPLRGSPRGNAGGGKEEPRSLAALSVRGTGVRWQHFRGRRTTGKALGEALRVGWLSIQSLSEHGGPGGQSSNRGGIEEKPRPFS